MSVKIAFHNHIITFRGSGDAIYQYAVYNEEMLGNKSIMCIPYSGIEKSEKETIEKFQNRFTLIFYKDKEKLHDLLKYENVDILYDINYGKQNFGIYFEDIFTVIHAVFDMTEPYGDVFAGVSEGLAKKFGKNEYVPHMIGLPVLPPEENMRKELGIPENATVLGRYGGKDTWNIDWGNTIIGIALHERKDLWLILANTPRFLNHPRVIHFDCITDDREKSRFINTTDAMIVNESLGHTFGIAIGEWSKHKKPIIVYSGSDIWNRIHLDILGNECLTFTNPTEMLVNLRYFDRTKKYGWDPYSKYRPENVMKQFDDVFIKPYRRKNN